MNHGEPTRVRDAYDLREFANRILFELVDKYGRDPGLFSAFEKVMSERLPGVRVERMGGNAQWKVLYNDLTVYSSVRMTMTSADMQRRLREVVAAARQIFLRDGADGLRRWKRGELDIDEAFELVADEIANPRKLSEGGKGGNSSGQMCTYCQRPERFDHLGGRHFCRVIVTYRCDGCKRKWTSQRGRYDPREKRVLDQHCSNPSCNERIADVVEKYPVSEEALERLQDRREQIQMRSFAAAGQHRVTAQADSTGDGPWDDWYDDVHDVAWNGEEDTSQDSTSQPGREEEEYYGSVGWDGGWHSGWHGRWHSGWDGAWRPAGDDYAWQDSTSQPGWKEDYGSVGWDGGWHSRWHSSWDRQPGREDSRRDGVWLPAGDPGTYVVGAATSGRERTLGGCKGYLGQGLWPKGGGKGAGSAAQPQAGRWGVVNLMVAVQDTELEQTVVPRLVTMEHRPDLCEPCRKWGDCSGWFADPFLAWLGVSFLLKEPIAASDGLEWDRIDGGFVLRHAAEHFGDIRLLIETRQA